LATVLPFFNAVFLLQSALLGSTKGFWISWLHLLSF
jgi:hypothetical protein